MPWALAKDEAKKDRLSQVLYNLVESIAIGAELLEPFMPETSEKILAQLGAKKRGFDAMDQFGLYPSGGKVTEKPEILFARMDIKEVMEKVEKLHPAPAPEAAAEAASGEKAGDGAQAKADGKANEKAAGNASAASDAVSNTDSAAQEDIPLTLREEISFDDFSKLQFAVGEIIKCEEVKKSRKLLCSQVKIGDSVRQILSGIKGPYTAEEMVGKKVMVLVNLKPAKMAGLVSEGMILCAEGPDGTLALMTPEKDLPSGSQIS